MPMNQMSTFKTKDLGEAAALSCRLRQPPTLESGDGHYLFVFQNPRALEISRRFWASTLKLDARQYAMALRALKDLVHRGPRG